MAWKGCCFVSNVYFGHYRAEQSSAVQCRAEQCSAVQCGAEQSRAVQFSAEQSRAVQFSAEQSRAQHSTAQHSRESKERITDRSYLGTRWIRVGFPSVIFMVSAGA